MSSDSRYELRLPSKEKADLQARADALGVSLTEAFRRGADQWLASREADAFPLLDAEDKELVNEFYAIAHKIDRSLRQRRTS